MEIRAFADDLDAVLVGAHRAVGAEAVEHALEGVGMGVGAPGGIPVQAQVRDVVVDADGEGMLRCQLFQLVEHCLDHGRREFLGGQPIAAADDLRQFREPAFTTDVMAGDGGEHVLVERLAIGARLLGAIQYRDAPDRGRQGLEQGL